jgi:benzoyl-CoA reductase subunit B
MMKAKKKEGPINRLKSLYPLRAKVDETYKKSAENIKVGKPVVWAMINCWFGDPILKAMDIETIYPENYGAVCASTGIAESYLDRSDKEGFPSHLCGYARNCLGYAASMMKDYEEHIPPEAPMGGMPKPAFLLSSNLGCDARYKWFQALGRYMDVPVWVLDMPVPGVKEFFIDGVYDRCIKLIVHELRDFVAFLERMFGIKMDWDRLADTVHHIEEMNRMWHKINELRKVKPCPMHSRDFWSAMTPSLFLAGNPKESLELYRNMFEEVKYRVDNHIGGIKTEERFRLLFSELPPWHSLKIFDKLAERGWNFVIESWSYHPPRPLDLNAIDDPLEHIARFAFHFKTGYFKEALEDGDFYGYTSYPMQKFAMEYLCDGAFLHQLMTCRSTSNHIPYLEERLRSQLRIPSLIIQGDIVDLRLFDQDALFRMVEPFEESMEHHRDKRKKEMNI